MENCAYLRKNPGYAPGSNKSLLTSFKRRWVIVFVVMFLIRAFVDLFGCLKMASFDIKWSWNIKRLYERVRYLINTKSSFKLSLIN